LLALPRNCNQCRAVAAKIILAERKSNNNKNELIQSNATPAAKNETFSLRQIKHRVEVQQGELLQMTGHIIRGNIGRI
jgi:hypothetical protein